MKTLCLKFHQNRAVNEEFCFWGGQNPFWGSQGGAEGPDLKKSKNPHTERGSQDTAEISAFQLN